MNEYACEQCGETIYFEGICPDCRVRNERDDILAMTQDEIDDAIHRICERMSTSGELSDEQDLLEKLIQYRNINTIEIADAAFARRIFRPEEIYKDASDEVVNDLIDLFAEEADARQASIMLTCLSIRGGKTVFDFFIDLEKHPEKWRGKIYPEPAFYPAYGGWVYDKDLNYHETNFDACYPMVESSPEAKATSPVKIGVPTDDRCPNCGCTIVDLMQINGTDERLNFLGIDGVIGARCCPNCVTVSEYAFCRYVPNEESEILWSRMRTNDELFLTEDDIRDLTSNTYVLGNEMMPPRYAAGWEGGSSVGGFAFWIQDCDILTCPECGKPMKYLAQVQWDTVIDYQEGNAYIEICRDCRILGVVHQQT